MAEPRESLTASGIAGPHWVRYGTAADQRYLIGDFRDTYDQLVVNGNMVAQMPSALSQFITQRAQKPFVIDPQTHAFAHDLEHLRSTSASSAGEVKRSWKKLIDKYGNTLSDVLLTEDRPLDPSDFDNESQRREFAENVLLFQKDAITREIEEGEDREYLEFLQEETDENPFIKPPELLIAPYFFIDGPLREEWFQLNLKFLSDSRSFLESKGVELPLAAQIVLSKEVLFDDDLREKMVDAYIDENPDVVLLWIDQFSEHTASESHLSHFIALLERFAGRGISVVNLYGGFFSVALARFSATLEGRLAAVCHGLEYGETRPVIPLGGGVPVARFYSRQLHHRLPPRVAYRSIDELGGLESADAFHRIICNCPNCKEVVQNAPKADIQSYFEVRESTFWRAGKRVAMDFPTAKASENCTKHYMWCKEGEYRNPDMTLDSIRLELDRADEQLRKIIGVDYAGHPRVWSKVLK